MTAVRSVLLGGVLGGYLRSVGPGRGGSTTTNFPIGYPACASTFAIWQLPLTGRPWPFGVRCCCRFSLEWAMAGGIPSPSWGGNVTNSFSLFCTYEYSQLAQPLFELKLDLVGNRYL